MVQHLYVFFLSLVKKISVCFPPYYVSLVFPHLHFLYKRTMMTES